MLPRTFAPPMIALGLSLLATTDVMAVGQRTYVASYGDDFNPCSLLQPCRSFAPAIALTNAGGEVVVLDSGGYGPFTITKSLSVISPPGAYAGMSVFPGGDGVVINAGVNDKIVLRGLTINSMGGNRGIVVNSAAEVHIEGCTVSNMAQNGIEINGGGHIHVRSSIVRESAWNGLLVAAGTPIVHVFDSQFARNLGNGIEVRVGTLDASRIAVEDNGAGFLLGPPAASAAVGATLADSVLSGNAGFGVAALSDKAGSTTRMTVVRTTSGRNATDGFIAQTQGSGTVFLSVSDSAGVQNTGLGVGASGSNATVVVTRSTFAGNTGPDLFQNNSAVLRSSGNNTLTGRLSDVVGTITSNPMF